MNDSPSRAADGMLCESQGSGDTSEDEEFLEDRAAKQWRHGLTLLTAAQIAPTAYLPV